MKFDRIVVMARCRVMSVNLKRSDRESLFRIADIKRRCLAQHRVWVMGVMFRYCKISHGLVVVIARDDRRCFCHRGIKRRDLSAWDRRMNERRIEHAIERHLRDEPGLAARLQYSVETRDRLADVAVLYV